MSRAQRRFYVDAVFPAEGAILTLSPCETFHLFRVLRLKTGNTCQVFNRQGRRAEAVVETISEEKGAQIRLQRIFPSEPSTFFLRVAQALPQKKKMDDLVRRAEELGVDELWALMTERTIVKMRSEASERVKKRWERIVIQAAKQSGSPGLMRVKGPVSFQEIFGERSFFENPIYLFHPDPSGLSFSDFIQELRERGRSNASVSASLLLGPEGGFTEEEVREAEAKGVRKVFLGDSILRVETAFLGVVSAVRLMVTSWQK